MKLHIGLRNVPNWFFKEFFGWNFEEALKRRSFAITEKMKGNFKFNDTQIIEADSIGINHVKYFIILLLKHIIQKGQADEECKN